MAITRTQIARQLYRVGGVGGRAEEGPVERGGMSNRDRGREESMKEAQRRADLRNITNRIRDEKIEEDLEKFRNLGSNQRKFQNFLTKISPVSMFASKFGPLNNKDFFLENYLSSKNAPMTKEQFSLLSPEEQQEEYDKYMAGRMSGVTDAYGNELNQGDGEGSNILLPQGIMTQAPSITEQEPEEKDEGLRLAFRANGGRIGFQGGGADLGTASSRDFGFGDRDARDDAAINRRMQNIGAGGSGGGKGPVIKEKPPVNIVKEKSNVQKIMDFFGLGSDDDQTGVSQKTVDAVLNPDAAKNFEKLTTQTGSLVSQDPELMKSLGLGKAEGGRIGLMEGGMPYEGGIMDLESARQMYGLGKLVKKVTRTVKKIAKSPIGKAALLYAGTAGLGALGAGATRATTGFGGIFNPGNVLANLGKTKALFTNKIFGDVVGPSKTGKSLLDLVGGKVGAGIIGVSALAGLMTPEQEEEAQQLSRGEGIDIEAARRMILQAGTPQDQRALAFRAEGGPAEGKEPVAKKTMPLLDMGGKEMDLRAEGGFVPIGRMEKADDVPARLSKNEFVFTADAVRNAGDGDVDKGAEVMYNMMKNLEAGGDVSEESQGLEGARKMFQTSQRLEEVL